MEHSTVRIRAELGSAIPEGMKGTLHLDWYDPNNVLANISTATNNGHGTRDNDEDVVLNAAENGLPGWTLAFTATDSGNESDSVQKSYLSIADARYADNFIVAAHPNADTVELYEFQSNILKYQDTTGLWSALPNSTSCDLITSTLTIMPSVDIDTDSDNSGTIERSDWEESIENEADYTGKYVRFNNNDDNENEVPDYLDSTTNSNGDIDLQQVVLDHGFVDLSGMNGWIFELKLVTGVDHGIKYWLNSQKNSIVGSLYAPDATSTINENGVQKTIYRWVVTNNEVNYPPSIYLEGVNNQSFEDILQWNLIKPAYSPSQQTDICIYTDADKVTNTFIDLDIDSDNDCFLACSAAEDAIESEPYALGKIITWYADDDFSGYTYFPMRLRLPINLLNSNDVFGIRFYDSNNNGRILIYTENVRESEPLTMGDTYSLTNLDYSNTTGTIDLFVRAYSYSQNTLTFAGIQQHRPTDIITAKLVINGAVKGEDVVQYIAAPVGSFVHNLQTREETRAMIASDYVYDTKMDARPFCLKKLDEGGLNNLGIPNAIANLPKNTEKGFQFAIYKDYISGKYFVAFAGTNDLEDVREDLSQALGFPLDQYQSAMQIAKNLQSTGISNEVIFTGHSLGGGLASAAACIGGRKAYTFNAAGLHQRTLDYAPGGPQDIQIYKANFANSQNFISAYYVDHDLLSMIQDSNPLIPSAIGVRYELDGPYDSEILLSWTVRAVAAIGSMHPGASIVSHIIGYLGNTMELWYCGYAHFRNQVYYGLLVDEDNSILGHDGEILIDLYGKAPD